jgi:acetyl esterase/lipase
VPAPDFTVHYGAHAEQIADIRLPARDWTGPPVFLIHGGFWRANADRQHTAPFAVALAGSGYPVATIEFRRVGQDGGGWPGTCADVAAAVAAVPRLMAERVGTENASRARDRPVLLGHSAGGHLALWAAKASPQSVRSVVTLAPMADLAMAHRLKLGNGAVAGFLGGAPAEVPDRYAAADPMRQLPLGVPVFIVHGTEDDYVPVDIARQYVTAARAAGDPATLIELPGMGHFDVIDPLSDAWPAVLEALAAGGS